jgi:hypothetical protein
MEALKTAQTNNFAYFEDPKNFEILQKFSIPKLKTFVKRNKGNSDKSYISTSSLSFPTLSQEKVLSFVDCHLQEKNPQPLRLILTGVAGKKPFFDFNHLPL